MKRLLLIVSFAFVLFFGYTVNAETISGRATVGRQAVMDTSGNYYYTDYKTLSDNSLNIVPMPVSAGDNFYIMGTEYIYPLALTGQTDFVITVRVPVADNTIYNYQLMDGLNQYDFKVGISSNFSVFNITPDIQVFNHVCGVYTKLGVAHTYCYYDITASFVLDTPTTSAVNLNFAVLNTSGNRSSYYYSGQGTSQVSSVEFPTGYFTSENWDYSVMSPTIRITTGTTTNNQDIIDNQNANTQEIIETIQENYQMLVDSQQVCQTIDKSNIVDNGYSLNSSGTLQSGYDSYGVSNYYRIDKSNVVVIKPLSVSNSSTRSCFYDVNKSLISCVTNAQLSTGSLSIPNNAVYVRFTIQKYLNEPQFQICQNGNQAIYDAFTDSSIDDHSVGNFFDGIHLFDDSTLSSVITAPLSFINSLDDACTPIVLTYRGQSITLPCGNTIFWDREDVSSFRAIWNALFGGLILYRLLRKLLQVVDNAMNPESNELGGLEL